jgi:hypothetical protein
VAKMAAQTNVILQVMPSRSAWQINSRDRPAVFLLTSPAIYLLLEFPLYYLRLCR